MSGNHRRADSELRNSRIIRVDDAIAARRQRIAERLKNSRSTSRRLTRENALRVRSARLWQRAYSEITGEQLVNKSFRSFSQSWLAAKRHEVAESTLAFYRKAANKFLAHLGVLADADLAEITREHVLDFRNREAETFAPKTVNHDLKAVKMLFLSAKRDGLIADNPAEDVKTVSQRGEKRTRRPFSLDELRAVVSVADDEWREHDSFRALHRSAPL